MTGDAAFDASVYVKLTHAGDEPALQSVLESAEVRRIVREFTERGVSIRIDPGPKAWLTARFREATSLEDRAELERLTDLLLELHATLPRFEQSGAVRSAPGCGCVFVVGSLAALCLLGLTLTNVVYETIGGRLEMLALAASPLLFGLFAYLAWRRLRGQSGGRNPFIAVLVVSLVAAPATSVLVARIVNATADPTIKVDRVEVSDQGVVRRKSRTRYWLEVKGLHGAPKPIVITIDEHSYRAVAQGMEVDLYIGEGRLGAPWVADIVPIMKITPAPPVPSATAAATSR